MEVKRALCAATMKVCTKCKADLTAHASLGEKKE